jgi:orotate phosphoribosyltransferase
MERDAGMSIEHSASEAEIRTILEQVNAMITGSHLVYTSGRHGSSYVNKDALYPHTAETRQVCAAIAARFRDADVEVVAGPTVGGVIMAQWVAHHLSELTCHPVLAVYAEEVGAEEERRRVFRRGYDELIAGKRVLIVEDVLTTGGSARQVVDAVRDAGGQVVGLGALCNRGGLTAAALDVPAFVALVAVPLESWDAVECPLCRAGVPINTRVGKGAAFLARQFTES